MTRMTQWGLAALGVVLLAGARPASAATALTAVVMYGIDADTWELVRYVFDEDEFVRIGVVTDQNNVIVKDCEALTFIPNGPHIGIYAGANFYQAIPSRLVKINGIDATCTRYPVNVGFNKIEGMTAVEVTPGNWSILAVSKHKNPGDNEHHLLWIDPATGLGTDIMETDERYDGLAISPTGIIYGWARDDGLWIINPITGTETRLPGNPPFDRVDCLEWAWGDSQPTIDCSTAGVPAAWTANGVLFGFDDDSNRLLILNPLSNANVMAYPCAFQTVDCEGLAFTTQMRDPYGRIVYNPFD